MTDLDLRTARLSAGYTQTGLAKALGLAQGTLSQWERGRATIPADRLGALTLRLGVPRGTIAPRQPLAPRESPRRPAECGTYSVAIGHVQRREVLCEACAQARRDYQASRRVPHPRPPAQCGSNRGYHAHLWRGEKACGQCRVAHAEYEQAQKRKRRRRR